MYYRGICVNKATLTLMLYTKFLWRRNSVWESFKFRRCHILQRLSC